MHDETHPHAHTGHVVEETTPSGLGPGYEVRDANVRGIVMFIIGLFIALILTEIAMKGMLNVIVGQRGPEATPTSPYAESPREAGYVPPAGKVTPEVALEITEQRRKLNAEEKAHAADIDRAIDRIARDGLPVSSGPARTEVEVNSHSGKPAPDAGNKPGKTGDGPGVDAPEVPGKESKK